MSPAELELLGDVAASSPYLVLGWYAIRRLAVWADQLCEVVELVRRLVAVAEHINNQGLHTVRRTRDDDAQEHQ